MDLTRRPLSLFSALLISLAAGLSASLPVMAWAASGPAAASSQPLLLRNPSLSQTTVAFLYGDDIWTVSRSGGEAQRLTSTGQVISGPYYSPDGSQIAYTAHLHGGFDAYIIPATGGIPRRATWHPSGSFVAGWTPDGKDLLIRSQMSSFRDYSRLFRVHADGSGIPSPLPLPSGVQGSFSADGQSIAYEPITRWEEAWKRYKGGQNFPIWVVNLKSLDLEKIPSDNTHDSNPVWVGDQIYFLSDRNAVATSNPFDNKHYGPVSLYRYDTKTKEVSSAVPNAGFDLKTLQAGPGGLVYEQFGSLHLVDLTSPSQPGQDHTLEIQIHGDLPNLVPHLATIAPDEIHNAALSPTGARAVFEAHGDIFTVPAEKGDTRNLTNTSDAAERDPAWSPDGKTIAYFSDASGEYQLFLKDQTGFKPPAVIDLGPSASYFYSPAWSPDSKHILFTDKHMRMWYVDVPSGKPVLIDQGLYGGFGASFGLAWSPDSKWIAYHRDLDNQLRAIFLYSLETHKSTQITDGMSDATGAVFDPNGKYLYFLASTDDGPSQGSGISSLDRGQTSAAYVVVLSKDEASPLPPESDDEKSKEEKKDDKKPEPAKTGDANSTKDDKTEGAAAGKYDKSKDSKEDKADAKPVVVKVDLEGIGNRILALPVPSRNYRELAAGKTGVLYLLEDAPFGRPTHDGDSGIRAVWRFTLEKRKTEQVLSDLNSFQVSADGSKALLSQHDSWSILATDDLKPGDSGTGKPLNVSNMTATIDPRAEWRQIYHETWRIERDFLYDPNTHGLSIPKIEARYRPYLDGLASRSEFTYLSTEMLGEITIGHMFLGGPYHPDHEPKLGLLGSDYAVDHDRYRFAKILGGQNWTPGLASPLTLPGVSVKDGEYLLAVNGKELHAADNLYALFDGTAGRQTVLHVGPNPDGTGSRDVTVVPIEDEEGLRRLDWMESNRRKVDQLSGGKVAYVYMPNTAGAGYTNFNRYFYAQLDKQGLILDERYNGGGFLADYVVDILKRSRLATAIARDGRPIKDPAGEIPGPKVMLINQNSGSGGDAMPWYFRKAGVGKLVGTRTWGGLVGLGGFPPLLDGGYVTAPRIAVYGLHGEWEVENRGIAPDVAVEDLPKDFMAGHDMQLETGVKLVMEDLKAHPNPEFAIPPYPNYHQSDGLGKD